MRLLVTVLCLKAELSIFENAPDAVMVLTHKGKIVKWNPEAEKLFGWKAEEVADKLLSETIIPSEFREAHQKDLQRFLSTRESSIIGNSIDMWAIKKNGTEVDVSLKIVQSSTYF